MLCVGLVLLGWMVCLLCMSGSRGLASRDAQILRSVDGPDLASQRVLPVRPPGPPSRDVYTTSWVNVRCPYSLLLRAHGPAPVIHHSAVGRISVHKVSRPSQIGLQPETVVSPYPWISSFGDPILAPWIHEVRGMISPSLPSVRCAYSLLLRGHAPAPVISHSHVVRRTAHSVSGGVILGVQTGDPP